MTLRQKNTHENSVELFAFHLGSIALETAVGTTYSVMKLPLVSLTLRVTPRLIVWRRRQAVSVLFEPLDAIEAGRAYGSPYAFGSN